MNVYIVRLFTKSDAGKVINVIVSASDSSEAITNAIRWSAKSDVISAKPEIVQNAMLDRVSFGWK